MRIAGEKVGRRGAAAVSVAALAAALLAIHGYGTPGSSGPVGSGGISSAHSTPSAAASGSSPKVSPSASPSAAGTPGPLLSSTPYASYTYQLYPGAVSGSARQALAGFTFTVHPAGSSVNFTLYVSGGGQSPVTKTYPASDHIYFVEASFGDDSGNSEYNFADDGLVVTDASGHVVQ
ncbi:MAG TPA: hypothetical protein VNH38_05720 [Candidatus Dormibacteraeota bacterium]|nr:hypothetical protein [Candidatus Dormibacteraeota bacterium]